ncbi:hypothetical protein [Novipirellula sp.]|uniref:hypothetical protein n=1 Tax=Novipirellula sp. TaxID=2795430 RepID=UPI0035689BDF
MNRIQFSTATLLLLTLLFAISLALSRFDSLWIPIAFPFSVGPIVAFRVTRAKPAFAIGILSSIYWTLVGIIPFVICSGIGICLVSMIDERLLTRTLFVTWTITYFLAVSIVGGYIGGVVARPD